MKTLAELNALASSMKFRPEVLEKVLKLLGILERLDRNDLSRDKWVLKVPSLSHCSQFSYFGKSANAGN
jgi:hypothetical protein